MNKLLLLSCLMFCTALAAQDVVIWNGGISQEDRESAPTDGTRLVFFVEGGSFLSDVQVVVKDGSGGTIVDTVTKGPWLILKLQPGRYSVLAKRDDGAAQGGYITVDGSNREYAYMFKRGGAD